MLKGCPWLHCLSLSKGPYFGRISSGKQCDIPNVAQGMFVLETSICATSVHFNAGGGSFSPALFFSIQRAQCLNKGVGWWGICTVPKSPIDRAEKANP